jgi:hypothetical protein
LSQSEQSNAAQALSLVARTRALVALLSAAGIPVIVLKGPLLSKRLYGDYGLRHAGDIDLLVDPNDAPRADQLLQQNAYVRTKPQKPLSSRRLALYLRTQHEFGYGASNGTGVELHWRYSDCPELFMGTFADLFARARPIAVGDTALPTLSPADDFLQLSIHGCLDGWSRLKWVADLPRALALVPENELAELERLASHRGLLRFVRVAQVLAGAPVNDRIDGPWLAPVLAHIARRMENPHPRSMRGTQRMRESIAANRYMLALIEGGRLRRDIAYCNLIMPADFDQSTLADGLTPLLPYVAQFKRGLKLFG